MHIPKLFACLLLVFVCNSTFADFEEDFESHPIGTLLTDIGFVAVIDYENATVQQVGRDASKGFEVFPQHDGFGFPFFGVDESGTNQVGDRILAGVDVRLRNGSLNSNETPTVFLQINPPNFNSIVVGGLNRVDKNLENFQLVLSTSSYGAITSEKKNFSEFGLQQNVPGEWTDWLRLELDIRKVAQNSFVLKLSLNAPNGMPILEIHGNGLDLSNTVENEISFVVVYNSQIRSATDRIQYDNFSYQVSAENIASVSPSSFNTVRGDLITGALDEVLQSDDSYLRFEPGFTLNSTEPPVWLEFEGQTSEQEVDALKFQLEANANTPGITQEIELFNWTTAQYDLVDSAAATFNTDSISMASFPETDNYLQAGLVKARCGWKKTGFTILFPWQVSIDQIEWTIFN